MNTPQQNKATFCAPQARKHGTRSPNCSGACSTAPRTEIRTILHLRQSALTFAIAALGAGLFYLIGFPAASLTGSAFLCCLAAVWGFKLGVPVWVRNICFLCLGISIGSTVTPDVLRGAANWPSSLLILAACLVGSMYLCQLLMRRGFGADHDTAVLATAPGHLSFVIAMAASGRGDPVAISVVQSTRLLFLTLIVPPAMLLLFGPTSLQLPDAPVLTPLRGSILLAGSAALGWLFERWRFPAAYMLSGLCLSALGHLSEVSPGSVPNEVLFVAMTILGSMIGARFAGVSIADLKRHALAGLLVTLTLLLTAILAALIMTALSNRPASELLTAYAPGGVEAMAAIAVQAGFDTTFVAAHHLVRLLILTFLIPIWLGRTA